MRFFIFLVSAILASGFVHSEDIKQRLHEYMSTLAEQEKFSGSVLVSKEGEVLLSQGYAMANYEFDIPNTVQTKFRLASVSKQFTAMAIMQLQEQLLLKLDDKISQYLPGYPHGNEISIHHLLTHTSGIAEISTLENFVGESIKAHSLEQAVEFFKHAPLNFPPGTKYSYSNSGYILLSYLVQIISQDTFENFLTKNIFSKLNMHNSGHDNNSAIIKNRAAGYNIAGDKMLNADYIHMSFPSGAGALYSTVEDLFKWDQALNGQSIFSKELLAEIFKPHVSMNDMGSYGYGWVIDKLNHRNVVFHNGGINGFSSNICRFVDDGVSIITLSNIEGVGIFRLTRTLAAIIFGEPYELPKLRIPIPLNPDLYDQYVGVYKSEDGFLLSIIKEDNRLFAQPQGQGAFELSPESETDFFHKTIDVQIIFIKDESGKANKLIIRDQQENILERVEATTTPAAQP